MYKILIEEAYKLLTKHETRLNPTMKEIVWDENLKLLNIRTIYAILYSSWVGPMQVVIKRWHDGCEEWERQANSKKDHDKMVYVYWLLQAW